MILGEKINIHRENIRSPFLAYVNVSGEDHEFVINVLNKFGYGLDTKIQHKTGEYLANTTDNRIYWSKYTTFSKSKANMLDPYAFILACINDSIEAGSVMKGYGRYFVVLKKENGYVYVKNLDSSFDVDVFRETDLSLVSSGKEMVDIFKKPSLLESTYRKVVLNHVWTDRTELLAKSNTNTCGTEYSMPASQLHVIKDQIVAKSNLVNKVTDTSQFIGRDNYVIFTDYNSGVKIVRDNERAEGLHFKEVCPRVLHSLLMRRQNGNPLPGEVIVDEKDNVLYFVDYVSVQGEEKLLCLDKDYKVTTVKPHMKRANGPQIAKYFGREELLISNAESPTWSWYQDCKDPTEAKCFKEVIKVSEHVEVDEKDIIVYDLPDDRYAANNKIRLQELDSKDNALLIRKHDDGYIDNKDEKFYIVKFKGGERYYITYDWDYIDDQVREKIEIVALHSNASYSSYATDLYVVSIHDVVHNAIEELQTCSFVTNLFFQPGYKTKEVLGIKEATPVTIVPDDWSGSMGVNCVLGSNISGMHPISTGESIREITFNITDGEEPSQTHDDMELNMQTLMGGKFNFGKLSTMNVKVSMFGIAGRRNNNDLVAFNKEAGKFVVVTDMTIDGVDVYGIPSTPEVLQENDIILDNASSETSLILVEDVDANGTVHGISYRNGRTVEIVPTTGLMGHSIHTKVISMFEMMGGSNPLTPGGDSSQFNPMMMLALSGGLSGSGKSNDMMTAMMMSGMMGGGNPFGNMFGGVSAPTPAAPQKAVAKKKAPAKKAAKKK